MCYTRKASTVTTGLGGASVAEKMMSREDGRPVDAFDTACQAVKDEEPGAVENLRHLTGEHPELLERIAEAGDMAAIAERRIAAVLSPGDALQEEKLRVWIEATQRDLEEPGDGALERILIRRVALCWFAVNTAEVMRAGNWKLGNLENDRAAFADRRVSRYTADLLKATRTLATVRKLRRPVVMVNVAEQQVNVIRP